MRLVDVEPLERWRADVGEVARCRTSRAPAATTPATRLQRHRQTWHATTWHGRNHHTTRQSNTSNHSTTSTLIIATTTGRGNAQRTCRGTSPTRVSVASSAAAIVYRTGTVPVAPRLPSQRRGCDCTVYDWSHSGILDTSPSRPWDVRRPAGEIDSWSTSGVHLNTAVPHTHNHTICHWQRIIHRDQIFLRQILPNSAGPFVKLSGDKFYTYNN